MPDLSSFNDPKDKLKDREMDAPQLIQHALDQIKQDTLQNQILQGREQDLSSLEKGRLIVKFLNKKGRPLANRRFYDQFYTEQDKAEKIKILTHVSQNAQ